MCFLSRVVFNWRQSDYAPTNQLQISFQDLSESLLWLNLYFHYLAIKYFHVWPVWSNFCLNYIFVWISTLSQSPFAFPSYSYFLVLIFYNKILFNILSTLSESLLPIQLVPSEEPDDGGGVTATARPAEQLHLGPHYYNVTRSLLRE